MTGSDSYWSSCCSETWPASGIQAEISTDCTFSSIGCRTLESSSILSNRRWYVAFVSCCISEWCVLATCLWMAEWLAKIWLQQHQQVPSLWLLSSFDATKAANDCEKEIFGFLLCTEFVSTDYTMLEWVLFHTLAFAWGFLLLLYFWNGTSETLKTNQSVIAHLSST